MIMMMRGNFVKARNLLDFQIPPLSRAQCDVQIATAAPPEQPPAKPRSENTEIPTKRLRKQGTFDNGSRVHLRGAYL